MHKKGEFCKDFCQHPTCWENALCHLKEMVSNERRFETSINTSEVEKLRKYYSNSDLQALAVQNLFLESELETNYPTISKKNYLLDRRRQKGFSIKNKGSQLKNFESKNKNPDEALRHIKEINAFNKMDPYNSRKCMIWMPNRSIDGSIHIQEPKNKEIGKKLLNDNLNNKPMNNEIIKTDKGNRMKKLKTMPPTGGQPYRHVRFLNRNAVTDEMMAELLGLSTDTIKYILTYSGEEHGLLKTLETNDYETLQHDSQIVILDRNQPNTFVLNENDSNTTSLSRFALNKELNKNGSWLQSHDRNLNEQIKNTPTTIALDLPPLPMGASVTRPFKYGKSNAINFSLEPVNMNVQLQNDLQAPSSARSKGATISPDTLLASASGCTTPYNLDIENYFKRSTSSNNRRSSERKSNNKDNAIDDFSISAMVSQPNVSIPPPPSPSGFRSDIPISHDHKRNQVKIEVNYYNTNTTEKEKNIGKTNYGMTIEAFNEIGDFLHEDFLLNNTDSEQRRQNIVPNSLSETEIVSDAKTEMNNRLELLSPIIEEQKHF